MTASLKIIAISVSVTLMVIAGIMVTPIMKEISDKLSPAPARLENTVVALYQTVQNELEGILDSQIVNQRNTQRAAIEQQLQSKGYTETFLNLLNDHSILMLARKVGITVKDWRI